MKFFLSTCLLAYFLIIPVLLSAQEDVPQGKEQRAYLVNVMLKIADPVLLSLSKNELKKQMPIESKFPDTRKDFIHLEAYARLLAGMAPWLELGPDKSEEGKLREKYIRIAIKGIKNATNPHAADYLNFNKGQQALVDAAFLAQAFLRAPNQLWKSLDQQSKQRVIQCLKSSRIIQPGYNNWLLFSGIIEAFLLKYDEGADMMRIDYALKQLLQWYKGDATYGDGPDFHWDYYNSFVIQPMLLEILQVVNDKKLDPSNNYELVLKRAQRYAAVQERMISPEGTYPIFGRSITYRFGAFQHLSKIAYMRKLPTYVTPAQVRYALYTVIKKQIEAPGTFDDEGWLKIGFYGSQPELGENYISTGSLYLCSQAFLFLGLPETDELWTAQNVDWTAKKIYKGESVNIDKALK